MATTPRIVAFSGSIRTGSYNARLIRLAADAARAAGADVSLINLADYPLPLYNGDLEANEGLPDAAMALKALFASHNGLLIAAPEYNSSMTPLFKNTIDWISRRAGEEAPLISYKGKVAALLSASPGALGGLRGLFHVRQVLTTLQVLVIPEQHAVSDAANAFDEQGGLRDPNRQAAVENVARRLVETVRRLAD